MASASLDAVFAALADPTRRRIVARLASGTARVGELAAPFAMSLPAVSKHLSVLERAGLLRRQREGRTQRCSLRPRPLHAVADFVIRTRRFWENNLAAFAHYVEQEMPRPRRRRRSRARR